MGAGTQVHPLALVEPGAVLGHDVRVGPFCHVGARATIGDRVVLTSHVVIAGATTIGADCEIHAHASLGGPPQTRRHKGGPTTLEIGDRCIIREGVTMHLGSDGSTGRTVVGSDGYFLAQCHVAHDCVVGDHVTMANLASLAGHCEIGDHVTLGGLSAIHQFVRIGHHAFIGGLTGIAGDIIPYGIAVGDRAHLRGLNVVGMRRAGLARADIRLVRRAYAMLFDRARPVDENIVAVRDAFAGQATVMDIVEFLTSRGKRHLIVPALDDALDGDGPAI